VKNIIAKWTLLVIVSILLVSCATTSYRDVYPLLNDGKYDSEFPYRGCSDQLERISESIRMLSCIAYYKSYIFPYESKVRYTDLQSPFIKEKANKEIFMNKTASGTATVIFYDNNRIALITCAHIVDFADTIITYYRIDDKKESEFIQSIAVKDHQTNYVASVQGVRDLEILAMDKNNDLAVVGQKMYESPKLGVPVFNYPIGKARELEWGAFVYLFGYPNGYQVITKGIVSSPNRDRKGSFLTDAVFSRGFSGGIIIAVRDGVPNFELVGMTALVPASQIYYVTPSKGGEAVDYEENTPFKGDLYVDKHADIFYGIAPAISSEIIVDFLESNHNKLVEKGYNLRRFLEQQPAAKKDSL
jgi:hypothetical protein